MDKKYVRFLLSGILLVLLAYGGEAAKFPSGFSVSFNRFNPVPQTIEAAQKSGWRLEGNKFANRIEDCYNNNLFFGYRAFEDQISLALLYDAAGQIAGYQVHLTEDFFSNSTFDPNLQPVFQRTVINGTTYLQLTFYFLHPSLICVPGRPHRDLSKGIILDYGYHQNGPTPADFNLLPVPRNRKFAPIFGWKHENCYTKMGYHNMYHVYEYTVTQCRSFFPAFALYDGPDGDMIGNGYFLHARQAETRPRFEKPPAALIKAIAGDDAPPCLLTENNTSFHVYFVQDGSKIACP